MTNINEEILQSLCAMMGFIERMDADQVSKTIDTYQEGNVQLDLYLEWLERCNDHKDDITNLGYFPHFNPSKKEIQIKNNISKIRELEDFFAILSESKDNEIIANIRKIRVNVLNKKILAKDLTNNENPFLFLFK